MNDAGHAWLDTVEIKHRMGMLTTTDPQATLSITEVSLVGLGLCIAVLDTGATCNGMSPDLYQMHMAKLAPTEREKARKQLKP